MDCPQCSFPNPPGAVLCKKCNTPFEVEEATIASVRASVVSNVLKTHSQLRLVGRVLESAANVSQRLTNPQALLI